MESPELVRAVRTAKRSPTYSTYRGHLRSRTPADVWPEPEQGLVIVTFHAGLDRPVAFYRVLAFSVDPSVDEVRDVGFLSLGLDAAGWHVSHLAAAG